MSGLRTWHNISLTAVFAVLPACGDDGGAAGTRDLGDAANTSDASQGTATPVEPDRSNASNADTLDAAIQRLDGGVGAQGDGGPVIGIIDPSDVDVVVVEAAAPLPAVCAPGEARELQVVATLPEGAIPLSVTPDGNVWAYALANNASPDAAAPSSDFDGAIANSDVDAAATPALDAAISRPDVASSAVSVESSSPDTESSVPDDVTAYSIHVASADAEWAFTLPSDQDPLRGAALDATGKHLVTTLADTKGFVLWALEENDDQFVMAADQPFERLNALAQQGGVRFEKPVFSAGGTRLYAHEVKANTTITQLVLRDSQWETELRITDAPLQTQQFTLSAVSADDLTLFGFRAADNRAVAWWRPTATDAFDTSLVLNATPRAVRPDCVEWWTLSVP